jgi:bifunctional non-homologous end joining protein LigD
VLPRFEPMLATRRPQLVLDEAWVVEPKLDGWRALVYLDDDGLVIRTRSGRDVTASLPELAGLAEVLPTGTVLDGELVAGQGRPVDFYAVAPGMAARRRRKPLSFVAFDVLVAGGMPVLHEPYRQRRAVLEDLNLHADTWCTASSFAGAPEAAIRACVEHGLEGVVLKHQESRYVPGKRSRHWVKLKTSTWRTDHAELRHER